MLEITEIKKCWKCFCRVASEMKVLMFRITLFRSENFTSGMRKTKVKMMQRWLMLIGKHTTRAKRK